MDNPMKSIFDFHGDQMGWIYKSLKNTIDPEDDIVDKEIKAIKKENI